MDNTKLEFSVGVFMLLGLACLGYLAINLGEIDLVGSDQYNLKARFVSSSGLKRGAFVEVGGVRVGKVVDISLDQETYELSLIHI